jgi:hypothetical protein
VGRQAIDQTLRDQNPISSCLRANPVYSMTGTDDRRSLSFRKTVVIGREDTAAQLTADTS